MTQKICDKAVLICDNFDYRDPETTIYVRLMVYPYRLKQCKAF